jgi:hypothetical protein
MELIGEGCCACTLKWGKNASPLEIVRSWEAFVVCGLHLD